jgi:glutamyl-tRNA reductase
VSLRIRPDESFESWATRVKEFEIDRARKRITKGEDVNLVLEEMSKAVTKKLLHPIINAIQDSTNTATYDNAASKKAYTDNYINKVGSKADHVQDDT